MRTIPLGRRGIPLTELPVTEAARRHPRSLEAWYLLGLRVTYVIILLSQHWLKTHPVCILKK